MMKNTKTRELNGIDQFAQANLVSAISNKSEMAAVKFQAAAQWSGGTTTETQTKDFAVGGGIQKRATTHRLRTDLPKPFVGTDTAMSAAELALHALAACLSSTFVYHCTLNDVEVRSVEIEVSGELDARGFLRLQTPAPIGYQSVSVNLKVDADAPREQLESFLNAAPVMDVFRRPVDVRTYFEMMG